MMNEVKKRPAKFPRQAFGSVEVMNPESTPMPFASVEMVSDFEKSPSPEFFLVVKKLSFSSQMQKSADEWMPIFIEFSNAMERNLTAPHALFDSLFKIRCKRALDRLSDQDQFLYNMIQLGLL